MKLFSKDNDYNLILEKVLDSKYFSSQAKNLLLSMIYKIEICYEDYKKVKGIDKEKEEFLSELIENIKKYLDNIKLVEPDSEEAEELKKHNVQALTNEKERSVLSYPTEIALLYAISDVTPKYFYIPNNFMLKNSFQNTLVNGYNQNNTEILADFNGWSWNVNLKFKNNIEDNLIYQNFLVIFGTEFMEKWLKSSNTKEKIFEEVRKEFVGTKYYEILCKYLYNKTQGKEKEKLEKMLETQKKELEKISDKPKYFEEVKTKKLKLLKEVEKLDKILNDREKLMKKYISENLKLEQDKRFPTVVSYKKILEMKRKDCLKEISILTNKVKPANYVKHKSELEEAVNFANNEIKDEDCIKELQIEFIKAFNDKIWELEEPEEILEYIYKLRYYQNLYINEHTKIKDKKSLKVEKLWDSLIKKACEKSVLRKISSNEEINSGVIQKILDTKNIDLKELRFEIKIVENKLFVKTYEKDIFEKEFKVTQEISKKEVLIRQNKIYKIFI